MATRGETAGGEGPAASRTQGLIAALAAAAIACHLLLRFGRRPCSSPLGLPPADLPLVLALTFGGTPLVLGLLRKLSRHEFGSDLLAGLSIVTSALLGEYLAGTLVVLMLSGGEALEAYAVRSASSVLAALARRVPSAAHRKDPGASRTSRSARWRSATSWSSSRTRPARWTGRWSRGTAPWTSPTSPASRT